MGDKEVREHLELLADWADIQRNGGERPDDMPPNVYLRARRWHKAEARALANRAIETGDDDDSDARRTIGGDLEREIIAAQFEPQSHVDFLPSDVAMHEAAHAVVALALGRKVEKVQLMKDGRGRCYSESFDDMVARGERPQRAALCRAVGALAGGRVCPNTPQSSADANIARNMTAEAGGSLDFWQRAERMAVRLVEKHRPEIVRVANALDRRKTLTGDQVANIVEGRPVLAKRKGD